MTIEQAAKELKGNASIITVSEYISNHTGEDISLVKPRVRNWLFGKYPNATTILSRTI